MTVTVMSPPRSHVTIATRGSMLALWQANYVAELLKKGGITSNQLIVKTTADRVQDRFLHEIGGKGLFVKELEEALAEGKADLAVHSLKDMPVKLPPNFKLAAILPRHAATDVIIFRKEIAARLKPKALLVAADLWAFGSLTIGTGSLRRQNLIERIAPALSCVGIRGNVDTRLRRLEAGEWDAIVLAEASLDRLGLRDQPSSRLGSDWFVPAPGQGALALETRADDPLADWLKSLACPDTTLAVNIEREILARLGGDCTLPFGCYVRGDRGAIPQLKAHAAVFSSRSEMAEAKHSQPYPDVANFDSKTFTDTLMNKLIEGGVAKALTQLGLQVPTRLKTSSKT